LARPCSISFPDDLKNLIIDSVDTIAELNGAYQHIVRYYLSEGEFPDNLEVKEMTSKWASARENGISNYGDKKVGLV